MTQRQSRSSLVSLSWSFFSVMEDLGLSEWILSSQDNDGSNNHAICAPMQPRGKIFNYLSVFHHFSKWFDRLSHVPIMSCNFERDEAFISPMLLKCVSEKSFWNWINRPKLLYMYDEVTISISKNTSQQTWYVMDNAFKFSN